MLLLYSCSGFQFFLTQTRMLFPTVHNALLYYHRDRLLLPLKQKLDIPNPPCFFCSPLQTHELQDLCQFLLLDFSESTPLMLFIPIVHRNCSYQADKRRPGTTSSLLECLLQVLLLMHPGGSITRIPVTEEMQTDFWDPRLGLAQLWLSQALGDEPAAEESFSCSISPSFPIRCK